MANLVIQNGNDLRFILQSKDGPLIDTDLAGLFFIAKYSGEEEFLRVTIQQRTTSEGEILPPITYAVVIEEITNGQG